MAEFVEQNMEKMSSIFEEMRANCLFSKIETTKLMKDCKEHEYRLQKNEKKLVDYLNYITFFKSVLKLAIIRRKKSNGQKRGVEFKVAKKICLLYDLATKRFAADTQLWLNYLQFLKKFNNKNVPWILKKMLEKHPNVPECWYLSAKCEYEDQKNPNAARQFLFQGIKRHPKSAELYKFLIRIELDEENRNPHKLMAIYKEALDKVCDVQFCIDLLNMLEAHESEDYEDCEELQKVIRRDLIEKFQHEPAMWDLMARRQLKGLPTFSDDESDENVNKTEKERIEDCCKVYQEGVKKVPKKEMWSLFISCLIEINDTDGLPNFKSKLLSNALNEAGLLEENTGLLDEKYYLLWIKKIMISNNNEDDKTRQKLKVIFKKATEIYPESESLWKEYLEFAQTINDEELENIFDKASSSLKKQAISLWDSRFKHIQSTHPLQLLKFFEKGLANPNISSYIQPTYIKWLAETEGIEHTRTKFQSLLLNSVPSIELFQAMIEVELSQPSVSVENTRSVFQKMTVWFGKYRTDIWLKYLQFEMKHGKEPKRIASIYNSAKINLRQKLVDKFEVAYSLAKMDPTWLNGK
ncbi:U3 small nucleolar RNA-associated protein 6 homolog [Trichogramma pretiosum]|uniref:U3 small nucleolar RNA-associated protein 6 homolog n=1 Tax=Trichogramma pretiosum TaxID=7493 RepID=UPI0006C97F8F|nr:U3 small nucleolar RNA-associated protein 6 homolog [Trichogramma pretiosum]